MFAFGVIKPVILTQIFFGVVANHTDDVVSPTVGHLNTLDLIMEPQLIKRSSTTVCSQDHQPQ